MNHPRVHRGRGVHQVTHFPAAGSQFRRLQRVLPQLGLGHRQPQSLRSTDDRDGGRVGSRVDGRAGGPDRPDQVRRGDRT